MKESRDAKSKLQDKVSFHCRCHRCCWGPGGRVHGQRQATHMAEDTDLDVRHQSFWARYICCCCCGQ